MVKHSPDSLGATLSALADPTRRAILARLAARELTVGEIARPFALSLPAVSKHLTVLEGASLVVRRKVGRERRCRLSPWPMKLAADWLEFYRRFWTESLDSLGDYLAATGAGARRRHQPRKESHADTKESRGRGRR